MLKLQESIIPNLLKIKNDPIKRKAFQAANEAMAELFTAGIIGNTCVRQQYLTAPMVQSLSKTCFAILLPMFLCTSIMKTIQSNGGKLSSSTIFIPIIAIGHCLSMNMISKFILLPLFQMDTNSDEGRATTVCCSFGNSGVIPLIFAEALFRHDSYILQKAYSFVSLYLVGWSPLFWSFGRYSLLGSISSSSSSRKIDSSSSDHSSSLTLFSIIGDILSSIKTLFPPPVIGVLFGLIVSTIPFLRRLFMEDKKIPSLSNGNLNTSTKPILGAMYNCFQNLGRAANPLALLVLTSSLALGTTKTPASTISSTNTRTTRLRKRTVNTDNDDTRKGSGGVTLLRRLSCVSIARFIISPLLMTTILYYVYGNITLLTSNNKNSGGTSSSSNDNVMIWFILMLESCMPPAQNSVLMLQVADKTEEASKLAKFLFSIYTTSMIPIVIISTFLLEKCRLTTT